MPRSPSRSNASSKKKSTITEEVADRDGYVARRSHHVSSKKFSQSDGATWQETLAVCEMGGNLTIRSYFTNLNTKARVWDEPPSGAMKIVDATEEMRRMAQLQLQEMQVATGQIEGTSPDRSKAKRKSGGLRGLFRRGKSDLGGDTSTSTNSHDKQEEKAAVLHRSRSSPSLDNNNSKSSRGSRISYKADSFIAKAQKKTKQQRKDEMTNRDHVDAALQEALAASLAEASGRPTDSYHHRSAHHRDADHELEMAMALSVSEHERREHGSVGQTSSTGSSSTPPHHHHRSSPSSGGFRKSSSRSVSPVAPGEQSYHSGRRPVSSFEETKSEVEPLEITDEAVEVVSAKYSIARNHDRQYHQQQTSRSSSSRPSRSRSFDQLDDLLEEPYYCKEGDARHHSSAKEPSKHRGNYARSKSTDRSERAERSAGYGATERSKRGSDRSNYSSTAERSIRAGDRSAAGAHVATERSVRAHRSMTNGRVEMSGHSRVSHSSRGSRSTGNTSLSSSTSKDRSKSYSPPMERGLAPISMEEADGLAHALDLNEEVSAAKSSSSPAALHRKQHPSYPATTLKRHSSEAPSRHTRSTGHDQHEALALKRYSSEGTSRGSRSYAHHEDRLPKSASSSRGGSGGDARSSGYLAPQPASLKRYASEGTSRGSRSYTHHQEDPLSKLASSSRSGTGSVVVRGSSPTALQQSREANRGRTMMANASSSERGYRSTSAQAARTSHHYDKRSLSYRASRSISPSPHMHRGGGGGGMTGRDFPRPENGHPDARRPAPPAPIWSR